MKGAGFNPERRPYRFLEYRGDKAVPLISYLGKSHKKRDKSRARAAQSLSAIYLRKGRINLASFFIRLAMHSVCKEGRKALLLELNIDRAAVLQARGRLDGAEKILDHVIKRAIHLGKVYLSGRASLGLARLKLSRGLFDESFSLISIAYWHFKNIKDEEGINLALLVKSRLLAFKGKVGRAIEIATAVKEYFSEFGGNPNLTDSLLTLIWLFLCAGEAEKANAMVEYIEEIGAVPKRWSLLRIRFLYLKHLVLKDTGLEQEANSLLKFCDSLRNSFGASRSIAMPESLYEREETEYHVNILESRVKELNVKYGVDIDSGLKFITGDRRLNCIIDEIRRVSPFPVPVLLLGESGVGKDVISRLIHHWSGREDNPYIPVNVSAIPRGLVESTLFGSTRGAYTGASRDVKGIVSMAMGGTVLLDEICDLESSLQPKLLRVVENGEYRVVGETIPRNTDARIIAATNKDIVTEVKNGHFREDLYHRLSVFVFNIPPLRQRRGDVPLLINHFVDRSCRQFGMGPFYIDSLTMNFLMSYKWPGNVRELKNKTLRAVINKRRGRLNINSFSISPLSLQDFNDHRSESYLESKLNDLERSEIIKALQMTGGNRSKAARLLGLNRTTMLYRMKKRGIGY
jgi:transcriptional regulator with GAF, ATPase, and Fis domain